KTPLSIRSLGERMEGIQHASFRRPLRDGDFFLGRDHGAVVIRPGEREDAAFLDLDGKLQVGIRGNGRLQFTFEYGLAVEGAGEALDDLARHDLAAWVLALTRFHHMSNERLDFDDLAFAGLLRQPYARLFRHD